MRLIAGKHKLTIIIVVIIGCIGISFLLFKPAPKKTAKPPIELNQDSSQQNKYDDAYSANQVNNAQNNDLTKDSTKSVIGPKQKAAIEYYQDGLTYKNQIQYSQAITSFSSAIRLDSKQAIFYQEKAEAEFNLGKVEVAIGTLQAGLNSNPNNEMLKNQLFNYQASR